MKLVTEKTKQYLLSVGYPNNEEIYYLDVWLWLWREKGIYIHIGFDCCISFNKEDYIPIILMVENPEEAIAKAIDYLVTNNLIK